MVQLLLIGLAAGAASGLLVAAVAGGSMLAVPLFYLAPLPVMVAGLAFSHMSALFAVAAAAVGLYLAFGSTFATAYVVGIGGPAWGLSYLALLARADAAARDGMTWFPVGGLVLASAGLAAFGVGFGLIALAGLDYDSYRSFVIAAFDAMVSAPGGPGRPHGDSAAMGALVAHILPATAGVAAMASQMACLYLAARAALHSGRLVRPWPDLAALRLPSATSLVLAVVLALSVVSGMSGLIASVLAATLVAAYALTGFAVVHFLTRGLGARSLILVAVWVSTFALGWPALVIAILGVVDAMFDLRTRFASGSGPPAANDR